jgi:hypothetical protein
MACCLAGSRPQDSCARAAHTQGAAPRPHTPHAHLLGWLGHECNAVLPAVVERAVAVVGRQRGRRQRRDGLRDVQGVKRLGREAQLRLLARQAGQPGVEDAAA